MPVNVFVSYSHTDSHLVKPIVQLLRATNDWVFHDEDSITPGKKWAEEINEALRIAHLVIVFWCDHSSKSAEVKKEYDFALTLEKDLLPVLLDPTPLPATLNQFQWVDFRENVRHKATPKTFWNPRTLIILGTLTVTLFSILFLFTFDELQPPPPPPIVASKPSPPIVAPKPSPPIVAPQPDYSQTFSLSLIIGLVLILILVWWIFRQASSRKNNSQRLAAALKAEISNRLKQ